jgi:hypothetical protein
MSLIKTLLLPLFIARSPVNRSIEQSPFPMLHARFLTLEAAWIVISTRIGL